MISPEQQVFLGPHHTPWVTVCHQIQHTLNRHPRQDPLHSQHKKDDRRLFFISHFLVFSKHSFQKNSALFVRLFFFLLFFVMFVIVLHTDYLSVGFSFSRSTQQIRRVCLRLLLQAEVEELLDSILLKSAITMYRLHVHCMRSPPVSLWKLHRCTNTCFFSFFVIQI